LQGKAEDAGGLTPVKDDNEVMRVPNRRTFLSIFGNCSNGWYAKDISRKVRSPKKMRGNAGIRDQLHTTLLECLTYVHKIKLPPHIIYHICSKQRLIPLCFPFRY